MPSPQMPHPPPHPHPSLATIPKLPPYGSGEVAVYLEQNQSMPWNLAPGGIDQFAHGTEDLVPLDNGNLFWGSEGWLLQQVGSYS